jgi:UDP-N-acetylglucosamine--N-acetylmuramyl-(pentapeptide) pyrophosphoryl-undecaprenol N-acetylglucosamine transferase
MAAGGTGGHVFPALAIADEIKSIKSNATIWFVGTKGKIEHRIVPQRGYTFRTIWISGFHRNLRLSNLLFPAKVLVSLVQSFFLIRQLSPDVVMGTGGYVCGPVLFVASVLRIPNVVHESNSYPGVTTRILSGRITRVFTAFAETVQWLKRSDNVELVGTPTRESLDGASKKESMEYFGLDVSKKAALVFGGSLGATSINRAISGSAKTLAAHGIQLIWQTGKSDFEELGKSVKENIAGWVGPFIERMDFAYAAADVVVSRAGATTIAELTRIGKPAILVPFPHAAADHQTMNAKSLAEVGAAILIPDDAVERELENEILALLKDDAKRDSMSKKSRALGKPLAGRIVAEKTLELIA